MWKEFNGQVQSKKQIHKNIMKLQLLISYRWTVGHCGDSSLKKNFDSNSGALCLRGRDCQWFLNQIRVGNGFFRIISE